MSSTLESVGEWRDRDEAGGTAGLTIRRGLLVLLAAVPVLALFNLFGQRSHDQHAETPAATLTVRAPSTLRGGLLAQIKISVTVRQPVKSAYLILNSGWVDGITINTIEPSPTTETSANGGLALGLGKLTPGQQYVEYLDVQVNPTSTGRRHQQVAVTDGADGPTLVSLNRTLTVFP